MSRDVPPSDTALRRAFAALRAEDAAATPRFRRPDAPRPAPRARWRPLPALGLAIALGVALALAVLFAPRPPPELPAIARGLPDAMPSDVFAAPATPIARRLPRIDTSPADREVPFL